ncbi:hypothetical protein [Chitinilyticum aquatile]|uniref:hypothetical protein n=1 Tax=Chitinilyticum aquatile TaxID=362520 RepID=UPI0004105856|nr:hypothetical protein [Chitinilyticum aquatile]
MSYSTALQISTEDVLSVLRSHPVNLGKFEPSLFSLSIVELAEQIFAGLDVDAIARATLKVCGAEAELLDLQTAEVHRRIAQKLAADGIIEWIGDEVSLAFNIELSRTRIVSDLLGQFMDSDHMPCMESELAAHCFESLLLSLHHNRVIQSEKGLHQAISASVHAVAMNLNDGVRVFTHETIAWDQFKSFLAHAREEDATGGIVAYRWEATADQTSTEPVLRRIDRDDDMLSRLVDMKQFSLLMIDSGNSAGDSWKYIFHPTLGLGIYVQE